MASSKTDQRVRWPCPVCLGVTMDKVVFGRIRRLHLDHCPRCGGLWLEYGEVAKLRERPQQDLWARIPRRDAPARAQCHTCHAHVDRTLDRCPSCNRKTRFSCPACERQMRPTRHGNLTLDVCRQCRGIWFDHHELDTIWQDADRALMKGKDGKALAETEPVYGTALLLDVLGHSPELLFYGGHLGGQVLEGAADAIGSAPELIGPAAEAAGEVAANVFEVIVEIVGGIFS